MEITDQPYPRESPTVTDLPTDTFARLDIDERALVHIAAVADGAKPGFVHPSFAEATIDTFTDILDAAELPYRVYHRAGGPWVAVASTTAAYRDMPPYETVDNLLAFEGETARQNGRFLGVPEPDNCWTYDDVDRDPAASIRPMLTECDIERPAGWRYLPLVSYLCRPTDAGIQRAADAGEAYYRACERAADACTDRTPVNAAEAIITNRTQHGNFYVDSREQTALLPNPSPS